MIAIRGAGSEIAKAVIRLLHPNEDFVAVGRDENIPLDADRYLFCQGLLRGKSLEDQTIEEIDESFWVNCERAVDDCDRLIAENDKARICVLGSESGFTGSYDATYAAHKRMLHLYVERRRLRTPEQQLICVAPGIVRDAGMTLRRTDTDRLRAREAAHPKKRFLTSAEVATLLYYCLYTSTPYLTNIVIRMNGGEHV